MATGSEEGAEVEGVDSSVVVAVDAAVGSERREIVADLKLSLEDIESAHQIDLLLEDVEDGTLNVVGEGVEATNAEGWAVKGDVSQEVVSAGKEHLEEAIVAQIAG